MHHNIINLHTAVTVSMLMANLSNDICLIKLLDTELLLFQVILITNEYI